MSDIALNIADFTLDNDARGDLVITSGIEAVAQRIAVALETWAGEWGFDTRYGTDYRGQVLGKNKPASVVGAELRRVILDVPGVIRFEAFSAKLSSTRALTVRFRAVTDEGVVSATATGGDVSSPMFTLFFHDLRPGWR